MFLVFEGLDGSGKSTLMQNFKLWLENDHGSSVYVTREPGGTPLGEEVRKVLLEIKSDENFKISPRAELLLYEASRAQHVEQIIRPKLQKGEVILCDRFMASSLAFQAGGRELSDEDVVWLNQFAIAGCFPDLQVFVDLDFQGCQERKKGLNEPLDRIESEASEFHNRVYASYKKQALAEPDHWVILDGKLSPQDLLHSLIDVVKQRGLLS